MKKLILVTVVICMATLANASKTFNSAKEYSNFLTWHHDRVEKMFKETHQMVHDERTNVVGIYESYAKMQIQCNNAIADIMEANVYANGKDMQASCIKLLCLYNTFGKRVLYEWLKIINDPNATKVQYIYAYKLQDIYYEELMLAAIDFDYAQIDYEDSNIVA